MTETAHALDGSHPTMLQELDRKAFEECERLALGLDQGKIGKAEFAVAMTALFNAVSGLCSKGIMDMIAEIRKEHCGVSPAHQAQTIALCGPKREIAVVSWKPGYQTTKLLLVRHPCDGIVHQSAASAGIHPEKAAKQRFFQIIKGLVAQGYRSAL